MNDRLVCIGCEEPFEEDYLGIWTGEGPLCLACWENEEQHASRLYHFFTGGYEVFYVGDNYTWDEYGEDASEQVNEILCQRAWVSTDAWRGYYETKPKEGYVVLAEGWYTGWVDNTTLRKRKLSELGEFLRSYEGEIPGEGIYILVELTSNLFSQAMTVFCQAKDVEAVCKWLAENGFAVADLDDALG